MADQITGKTQVDAVSKEVIASIVQDELIQQSMLLGTVLDFSNLAEKGSDTVSIPRTGSFTAEEKQEGVALNAQALTLAVDKILLNKHYAVQAVIEKFAKVQANVELFGEYLKRMGSALALKVDQEIIAAILATSEASPDHRRAFAGASIAKDDFITARMLLRQANVKLDDNVFCAINPEEEAKILALSDFVDADKWASGSETAKQNGLIGKAYGCKIIVTNVVPAGKAAFYHKSHVAFALQQEPEYDEQKELANLATRISLDHVYGVKTMDLGKRGVLMGSAT